MALIVLSAILVVVAIVFLIRKNLQYANYTYVGYVLLAIIGSIYGYVGLQDAVQLVQDETMRFDNEYWFKSCQHFLYRHQYSLPSSCLL